MQLLPGRWSQWEATPSVSFRHCQCQWPLVAVPSGQAPALCKGGHATWTVVTALVHPWHSGVSGIRTKALNSHLYFMAKKKKKRRKEDKLSVSCSHVAIKATKGENAFFKLATGQNLQKMRVGLCFFLFTYIPYALIFFFLVPKMKENFDIWDARKLRSYFCWLELSLVFGDLKKKIIKV